MNDEDKKLIDHATAITSPATPGPWQWWTSCSYRRLSSVPSGADGDVIHGVVQRDGHPDVYCSEADRAFIAESRMLVPGLVDLALRESSRADAAEEKLAQAKAQIERLKQEVFDAGARIIRVRFEANDQHDRAAAAEAALTAANKRIVELDAALAAASPRPHSS